MPKSRVSKTPANKKETKEYESSAQMDTAALFPAVLIHRFVTRHSRGSTAMHWKIRIAITFFVEVSMPLERTAMVTAVPMTALNI